MSASTSWLQIMELLRKISHLKNVIEDKDIIIDEMKKQITNLKTEIIAKDVGFRTFFGQVYVADKIKLDP